MQQEQTAPMLTPERTRQLRNAAKKLDQALAVRDLLVRTAWAEGGGLREIAREVGLSHAGVKKIVERA